MTSEAQSLPSDPPPRRPSADADETSYAPTPTQEAFWSMAALAPGRPVGNEALVFELRGPLDVDALRAAVDHLEARHDLWRTRLTPRAGALRAVVDPPTGAMLHVVDATGADDRARELERRTAAILAQPFDLAHEPAIRITLLRFAPDHHALVFTGHHALYDGVSFLVLMPQELARLYAAHRDGREVPVEEASFRAFAERERAELAGAPGREARAHWRRELADVPPPLELPADHRRPAVRSLRGARLERTLSREATDTLLDVERRAEVRRIDLLLATFAILLGRLGDRDDLTIGTAHANRRDPRNAELLGCLVRTLPIRASMTDRPTPAALAKRIRSARGRAFAHLEDVVDELLVERFPNDPSRHPGYQVVLNYMPFALEGLRFADLDVRVHRPDPGWTATDLSVDVIETSEGLRCVFEYDTGLFDEPTVRAWLDAFLTALEALPAGVDDPLDALPLLSAEARRELERLGDGDGPAARAIPITAELAAAAAQHADAVALVRGDRRITYRELWSRAGAIATRIAARPRPAEGPALVGIARSDPADALVAMVGALRAGVAYVPLDPDLPPRRLAQMLEDARPMAVIADAPDERFGAIPRIDPGAPHPGSDPRRRDAARADDPAADDPAADDP
ncbi:MAG TPA: condensation domain-containing protein, partial [Sandaracinaceae bacterium LLY-WYZ-13_1]|nr:condensation domain-containing protein [Sandaracinaceae bacterium LLY-WYZ-13_1]